MPECLRISESSDIVHESIALQIQGVRATQSCCFICQSKNERKSIPWSAIRQAWFEKRCYIPKSNRSCEKHLCDSNSFTDDALELIEALKQNINVKIEDFNLWLNTISDLPKTTPYNFEEDGIESAKYKMLLGVDKDSFDDLVQHLIGKLHDFFLYSSLTSLF